MSTIAPARGPQAAALPSSNRETLNTRSSGTPSLSSRMSERLSISSTKYGPSVCSGLTTQVEAVSAAATREGYGCRRRPHEAEHLPSAEIADLWSILCWVSFHEVCLLQRPS